MATPVGSETHRPRTARTRHPGRVRIVARVAVVLLLVGTSAGAVPGLAPTSPAGAAPAAPACSPVFDPGTAAHLEARYGGNHLTAAVLDERTGCWYHLAPHRRVTTASVFKISMMGRVLLDAQRAGRPVSAWEDQRIRPMIAESADPPTNELFAAAGGAGAMRAFFAEAGMGSTALDDGVWGLTRSSAADQVELLRRLVGDRPGLFSAASRHAADGYLRSVVPAQRWGVPAGLPPGWGAALKNGFFPARCCGWRIGTAGRVSGPDGRGYVVAVLSDGWRSQGEGIVAVEEVTRHVNAHLAVPDPGNRAPRGSLDALVPEGGRLAASGWAQDPDEPLGPLTVELWRIDPAGHRRLAVATTGRPRPDVNAVIGVGGDHGWGLAADVPVGGGRLCAFAVNRYDGRDAGWPTALGCRDVADRSPIGALDHAGDAGEATVRVAGWAWDRDAAVTEVAVTVDGVPAAAVVADEPRPDVAAAVGSPTAVGFDVAVAVAPGTRRICVTALDTAPGADRELGCRVVWVADPAGTFVDVLTSWPAWPAIDWAHAGGIVDGWPDGTFRPAVPVTRQAMVAMLWRAAGRPDAGGATGFSDVGAGHRFAEAIAWAAAEGIVEGWPDGTFRPTAPVSRQAAVAMLWRVAGRPDAGAATGFSDVGAGHRFAEAIAWASSGDVTEGWPDGTFRPTTPASRSAGVQFLWRTRR